MTYVEKSQMSGPYVGAPGGGGLRSAAGRILVALVAGPLAAWRNSRDLREISRLSTEQLRDIGLTPADVVAANCAPFHVGAGIMLAHLAERRRQCADPPPEGEAARSETTMRQPS